MGSSASQTEQKYQMLPEEQPINRPLEFKESTFKLHIAIDFGTNGCGLGFAYNGKVIIYNQWRGQTQKSNSRVITRKKTKTQLILNDQNKVTCFGNAAKFMYYNFEEEERKEKKFFEKFKMALYEDKIGRIQEIVEADEEKKRYDINTEQYVYAADDQRVAAKTVFIAAFQQLHAKAKEFIPKNITQEIIHDDEIQWIVTVPAIWSQKAKDNMKKWIIEAGFVKENILNQCVIVYEPDCASLSIQKQYFRNEYRMPIAKKLISNPTDNTTDNHDMEEEKINAKESMFEQDDKYILIDAGGGTVDIACHKIRSDGSVEEIVYPTGGAWGAAYIDELFVKLLGQIFGQEFINNYKAQNPANFVEVMERFEFAKKTFYRNAKALTHRIQIPNDFMCSLYEKYEKMKLEPQQIVNQFAKSNKLNAYRMLFGYVQPVQENDDTEDNKYEDDESICVLRLIREKNENEDDTDTDDSEEEDKDYRYIKYLEMDVKIWKCLFDSKINLIISHVVKLLKMKAMKHCKYLGLVGGFACSKYFQKRMDDTFGIFSDYTMNIIIPNKPMLSVVEGAALMAITEDYIRARKLPLTYGVCLRVRKSEGRKYGLSDEYITNNIGNDGFVSGCFFVLARRNERIGVNEVRIKESYRKNKTHSTVPIYQSEHLNPICRDDGEEIARLQPLHLDKQQRLNITEFHFYGTMMKVYSYPKTSPQQRESMVIHFN